MAVQLFEEERPIVRITYADGRNCRYVGDAYGTWEIAPFTGLHKSPAIALILALLTAVEGSKKESRDG